MSLIPTVRSPLSRRLLVGAISGALLLVSLGVMANQGWLPHTDTVSGEKFGWFGNKLPKNAGSTWNPFAAPLPTPTPQLSKEYIYAGSRLLAVEDANANAAPPADLAIWRPQFGIWYVQNSQGTQQQWGQQDDVPVPGDYDGDGKTDFTVFRPSTNVWWIWQTSVGAYTVVTLGTTGDVPAPADYDGDGKTDCAVFRASNGIWYIYQSSNLTTTTKTLGTTGDKVAPADYDGDGKADAAVWRFGSATSEFIILKSSNNQSQTVNLGSASTDQPVSADYDGDGKADFALLGGNV